MFRRHWSGLPKDVTFPSSLKELGYFVNDDDEIRSIENPDCYFKFFIDKNARVNARQRFAFNHAMEKIIHDRLQEHGLKKITVPLNTPVTQPHVPIFVSPDLSSKSRVVVIFGEPIQDLGVLAGRMANGPGGINKGSMVSVVQALQGQASSKEDTSPPGIILANTGQLYWWPDESRALTVHASQDIPLPSLAHSGRLHVPSMNNIPENHDPRSHIKYMIDRALPKLLSGSNSKVDIIAIGESCHFVEEFLDIDQNWETWGSKLNAMLLIGTVYPTDDLKNEAFKKFLAQRTRGYLVCSEDIDTPLASPEGSYARGIPPLGCPCFSSSEPAYIEMVLIRALQPALSYLEQVATASEEFVNPEIIIPEPLQEEMEDNWENLPAEEMPSVSVVDPKVMEERVEAGKTMEEIRRNGTGANGVWRWC